MLKARPGGVIPRMGQASATIRAQLPGGGLFPEDMNAGPRRRADDGAIAANAWATRPVRSVRASERMQTEGIGVAGPDVPGVMQQHADGVPRRPEPACRTQRHAASKAARRAPRRS